MIGHRLFGVVTAHQWSQATMRGVALGAKMDPAGGVFLPGERRQVIRHMLDMVRPLLPHVFLFRCYRSLSTPPPGGTRTKAMPGPAH